MKCRKNKESKNTKVIRTKNVRIMFLSKCSVCNSKKSKFLKQQVARGLLSSLGIRTRLSQILLLSPLLFLKYKTNEIINKFSLDGDKSMSEMHVRQLGFTYGACGPFTKIKERIK